MGEMITLEQIKARRAKITSPPWGVLPSNNSNLAHVETQEGRENVEQGFSVCSIPKKRIDDAEFIANAPADIDYLLSQLTTIQSERDEALREVERLRGALRVIQDSEESDVGVYAQLCLDTASAMLTGAGEKE